MKRTEQLLPWAFAASALTGIGLHAAGHGTSHAAWHAWAVAHVAASLLFLLCFFVHALHRRGGFHPRPGQSAMLRPRPGLRLLAVAMGAVAATGLWLLGVEGANSLPGLWHYRLGLLLTILSLFHIFHQARHRKKRRKVARIDPPQCVGCGRCLAACPRQVLQLDTTPEGRKAVVAQPDCCTACGRCVKACKRGALQLADRTPDCAKG